MTISPTQITWSAANSLSVSSGSGSNSDNQTLNTDAIDRVITLKADNNGTPAAGDTVDFFLQATSGDPDGAGGDEYPDNEHSEFLARLDTNQSDPAIKTVQIRSVAFEKFRIRAVNNAASNAITVSAEISERR